MAQAPQIAEKIDSAEDLVAQALLPVCFCGLLAIRRLEVLRKPHRQECLLLNASHISRVAVSSVSRDTPAMSMYSEAVLDHFQNPRNAGTLDAASAKISTENPVCGDILELSARLESGRIAEARFRTRGCVTALACSSLLTELLRGKTPAEARAITAEQISEALGGLTPTTLHAAQLARDAAQALAAKLV